MPQCHWRELWHSGPTYIPFNAASPATACTLWLVTCGQVLMHTGQQSPIAASGRSAASQSVLSI